MVKACSPPHVQRIPSWSSIVGPLLEIQTSSRFSHHGYGTGTSFPPLAVKVSAPGAAHNSLPSFHLLQGLSEALRNHNSLHSLQLLTTPSISSLRSGTWEVPLSLLGSATSWHIRCDVVALGACLGALAWPRSLQLLQTLRETLLEPDLAPWQQMRCADEMSWIS